MKIWQKPKAGASIFDPLKQAMCKTHGRCKRDKRLWLATAVSEDAKDKDFAKCSL
jgi:hypothetical protein